MLFMKNAIKAGLLRDEKAKDTERTETSEKNSIMKKYRQKNGFTLIELLVVVVILAIAAAMAVPMFSGSAQMQVASAANMIAADLEYAKSMAISRQKIFGVAFDTANNKYDVVEYNDVTFHDDIQWHPVKKGFPYTINFSTDSRLKSVVLTSTNFGDQIYFNYLGTPCTNAAGTTLNSQGEIWLQGGETKIIIEPTTGYIRIQ